MRHRTSTNAVSLCLLSLLPLCLKVLAGSSLYCCVYRRLSSFTSALSLLSITVHRVFSSASVVLVAANQLRMQMCVAPAPLQIERYQLSGTSGRRGPVRNCRCRPQSLEGYHHSGVSCLLQTHQLCTPSHTRHPRRTNSERGWMQIRVQSAPNWIARFLRLRLRIFHRRPDIAAISDTPLNKETSRFKGANSIASDSDLIFCEFRVKIALEFPCDLIPAKEKAIAICEFGALSLGGFGAL